jgi:DNA-binding NarL/FixJ family response regulator
MVAQMAIRVLLVDNQVLLRHGIKAALESERAVDIVGEASTAGDAIEKTAALQPDLVLIEIALPNGDAIAAIRTIRQRWPRTQVLVLTSCVDQESFRKAAAAGAIGYILKDIEPVNLANAIRAAYSGKTMLSPTIAGLLVNHYFLSSASGGRAMDPVADSKPRLTQHEIDVLAGVVQGLSDKRIAANLFLSEATVKTRLRAIYHKLGLRNRAHAAVYAVEHGLFKSSCLVAVLSSLIALLAMLAAA